MNLCLTCIWIPAMSASHSYTVKLEMPADPTLRYTLPADPTLRFTLPADPTLRYTLPADTTPRYTLPADPTLRYTLPADPTLRYTLPADTTLRYTLPQGSRLFPGFSDYCACVKNFDPKFPIKSLHTHTYRNSATTSYVPESDSWSTLSDNRWCPVRGGTLV